MELYKGIIIFDKSFCNQDSQSFREHEPSSRLAPTSTMLVFLTFTFLFEKFSVPLFIFLFLNYIKALNRNKWLLNDSLKLPGCLPGSAFFKAIKLGI